MKAISLASGSKGNSYLITTYGSKILIDNGLSEKTLLEKLNLLKVNPESLDAIFITHEHADHVKGLKTFLKKYNAKIYVHNDSAKYVDKELNGTLKNEKIFYDNEIITLNDIIVENFTQSHDSKHCCGFTIKDSEASISISTDLGVMNENILNHLKNSNLVYLEANHDINLLLDNPNYPAFLKQRILSNKGHLSNKSSSEVITKLCYSGVKQIVLSHLSEDNNSPSLAYHYIKDQLKQENILEGEDIFIDVATQYNLGTAFNITKND